MMMVGSPCLRSAGSSGSSFGCTALTIRRHIHVRYGREKALLEIDTLAVLEGWLSPRVLGLVTQWWALHRAELSENWNFARDHSPLKMIQPSE